MLNEGEKHLIITDKKKIIPGLVYSRLYFYNNPSFYILLKFLIGLIFFTIPIFLFLNLFKTDMEHKNYENIKIFMPLTICVSLALIYITILLTNKLYQILTNTTSIFSSADRSNTGELIDSLIILVGIYSFLKSLKNFFSFFMILKIKLIENNISYNEINSIFTNILLYDILNDINYENNLTDNKLIKGDLTNNIIFKEILNLFNPILFITIFYFIKISFFKTKYTYIKLSIVLCSTFEYIYLYSTREPEKKYNRYIEILPIIFIFGLFILLVIKKSFKLMKKRCDSIEKQSFLILNLIFVCGLILLIYFLFICIQIEFNTSIDNKELNFLKNISYLGLVLIIFGNTLNYGNFILDLLYKPFEKQYFYKPFRKYYKRYINKFYIEEDPLLSMDRIEMEYND